MQADTYRTRYIDFNCATQPSADIFMREGYQIFVYNFFVFYRNISFKGKI